MASQAPSLKLWELENNVQLVDPRRDALYRFDQEAHKKSTADRPWQHNPRYFKNVRISATALIKMVMHARSGGSLEVMGLMTGYISGDAFIVTDAFRLPVEGTETRVNAHADADEYMVEWLTANREQGRMENAVGWYHSHPGYGCWLSGIDVQTQFTHQSFQDPFLAVVIDPERTISAGKVEIGAFRTFPTTSASTAGTGGGSSGGGSGADNNNSNNNNNNNTASNSNNNSSSSNNNAAATADGWQAVPLAKAAEFGAHADKYYSLDVSHYKSTLDSQLLELLWHKYWVQTLSQSPLLTNRDYGNKQMLDLASKLRDTTSKLTRQGRAPPGQGQGGSGGPTMAGVSAGRDAGGDGGGGGGGPKKLDAMVEKLAQDCNSVAAQEKSGLMAGEIKSKLFNGLGPSSGVNAQS